MFYIVAIFFVIVSPLAVPVTVTIVHAIGNWRQSAGAARVTNPVTTPTLRHTAPAAA